MNIERNHAWYVDGVRAGVNEGGDTIALLLEKGILLAGGVRAGALSDGQGKRLAERFASPLMPQVLVFSRAGAITGLGALSDGMMAGSAARIAAELSLPESSLWLFSTGEDAKLMAADPIVKGAREAFQKATQNEEADAPDWLTSTFRPLLFPHGTRFQVAGWLVGDLSENTNRHLVLMTDFPLSQTELKKVEAPLKAQAFRLYALHGVDSSADSVTVLSTGKALQTTLLSPEERVGFLTQTMQMVLEELLKKASAKVGWTHEVQITGAQDESEVSALALCLARAFVRLATMPERSWQEAVHALRREVARSGVETLGAEDLTWMAGDVLLSEEGKTRTGEASDAAWRAALEGKLPFWWSLARGQAKGKVWC